MTQWWTLEGDEVSMGFPMGNLTSLHLTTGFKTWLQRIFKAAGIFAHWFGSNLNVKGFLYPCLFFFNLRDQIIHATHSPQRAYGDPVRPWLESRPSLDLWLRPVRRRYAAPLIKSTGESPRGLLPQLSWSSPPDQQPRGNRCLTRHREASRDAASANMHGRSRRCCFIRFMFVPHIVYRSIWNSLPVVNS